MLSKAEHHRVTSRGLVILESFSIGPPERVMHLIFN